MKQTIKLFIVTFAVLTLVFISILPAFAAESYQDGLKVNLELDKSEYSMGETVKAVLEVQNTNDYDVKNVKIANSIPDGFIQKNKENLSLTKDTLKPKETISLSFEFSIENIPNLSTDKNSTIDQVDKNDTPNNTVSGTDGGAIATGQQVAIIVVLLVALIAGIMTVYYIRNRKGKQLLSIVLCLLVSLSSIPLSGLSSKAAETENNQQNQKTINIAEVFSYNKKQSLMNSQVQYENSNEQMDILSINIGNMLFDSEENYYVLMDEMPQLTGQLINHDSVKSAVCTVTDSNGKELLRKNFSPEEKWSVDDFGLIVGVNYVKVYVEYDDGKTDEENVVINNLNEKNMKLLSVDTGDNDKDGVLNFTEELYHTNKDKADSDGDGLSDYDEMAVLGTDPNNSDTDNNGISDADEDADKDGLTNIDEIQKHKTNPVCIDSDGDTISDYDEVTKYKTVPNEADSDGDKASDGWEINYGFDPLTPNADFGDYSINGDSSVVNEDGSEITVVIDDEFIKSAPGYMGVSPINVELGDNTSTTISIPFDSSNLRDGDTPTIYYYDEKTQAFKEVPTTINDDGTAASTVDKSGTYVLLNRRYVYDVWENDIITEPGKVTEGNVDIVFVVDCSPSMSDNDPDNKRQQVLTEFVNKLRPDDKAAIVTFTNKATTAVPLTNDKSDLKNAIDNGAIYADDGSCGSDSGTNGAAGLRYALNELLDKEKSDAPNKSIIFLADGVDDNSENQEFYNTYPEIETDAKAQNIIIHTVGLVGNGSVDVDLLKEIAKQTGGNYYLATAGTATEKDEYKDALPIEDVYKEIATETLDEDSNHDGISDYLTKLMCEGKILDSKGQHIFGGADFETVQSVQRDFDGDGLSNGEEVELAPTKNYFVVHSYPYAFDSDKDTISDYDETKVFETSCLKYNTNVRKTAVDLVTNNDYYQSSYWGDILKKNIFAKGSVFIGNAFYGTTINQDVFYEQVLSDYFTDLNEELFNNEVITNYQSIASSFTEAAFREDFRKCTIAAEKNDGTLIESLSELTSKIDEFCNVAGLGNNTSKVLGFFNELSNIANGNQAELKYINNILTRVETNLANLPFAIDDSVALKNYAKALQNIKSDFTAAGNTLKVKMNSTFLSKLGRGVDVVDKGVKQALPILDKAAADAVGDIVSIISIGINGVESITNACEEYSGMMSNLEVMQKNMYILDAICAQTDDINLRSAANGIRYNVQTSMNDLLSNLSLTTDTYGNAVISISLDTIHFICQKIPYTLPFEIVRTIGNAFLHTSDAAETITKSVAAAEISNVLTNHFINGLEGGNASDANGAADRWVAYSDYSADMYIYLLNLCVIRRNSEKYVVEKDIGLSNEMISSCNSTIDTCNSIFTEYCAKLVAYNRYAIFEK